MSDRFSAKILLFGEYTIIKGSKGLAFPFDHYHAAFSQADSPDDVQKSFRLEELYQYLASSSILSENMDLKAFQDDIARGLFLNSNIPPGYGLGSSGALCAAIYARYANDFERKDFYTNDELNRLKDMMALMENFYHGTSSGLDCLISLVDQPVLIREKHTYELVKKPNLNKFGSFYLFDSGISRKTAGFVHGFLEKYEENQDYKNNIDLHVDLVNNLIDNVTSGNKAEFHHNFYNLSEFQLKNFSDMVPATVKELWGTGLDTKEYLFKLCGAGGGGFFLVYSDQGSFRPGEKYISV